MSLRESFAHVPRTLGMVWRVSASGTLVLAVLTLAVAMLPVAMAWVGKHIVDAVVAGNRDDTLYWVLVELALVAALALSQRLNLLSRQLLGARLSLAVNAMIIDKALTLELRHFEDPEFYDQLTRARREASARPLSVVTSTFGIAQNLASLAGFTALLLGYSPWAVLGLAAAAIPSTLAEMRFATSAFRLRNWRAPDSRKLSYLEYVLTNDNHAKEVKLFGLGPTLVARYKQLGERFYHEDRKLAWQRAAWGYGLSLLATLAFYGAYASMALGAAASAITLGQMTLYVAAFRSGQQSFQATLTAVGGMYEDGLYMSNLFRFLAIDNGTPVNPPRALPAGGERGIRFEGVGYQYPGAERWALRNIDLFVPAGQSLALVGENGAGKTTFIKLLTRLYRPTEGRILLDGRDLAEWNEAELRGRIGVIFQDFNEYQLPVSENVGFGSVDHVEDRPRVERAVDRGGALELVKTLSAGLDTQLGRWFKGGAELSGGQWQKVAIARAFMREEADILVLDEPTAALDARAEKAVFDRFRELTRGRTTILISHRFPTVRMADKIIVIEDGHVREQGSHEELVAAGGRYAKLFGLQAEGYR